jgi:hypothetical protein
VRGVVELDSDDDHEGGYVLYEYVSQDGDLLSAQPCYLPTLSPPG